MKKAVKWGRGGVGANAIWPCMPRIANNWHAAARRRGMHRTRIHLRTYFRILVLRCAHRTWMLETTNDITHRFAPFRQVPSEHEDWLGWHDPPRIPTSAPRPLTTTSTIHTHLHRRLGATRRPLSLPPSERPFLRRGDAFGTYPICMNACYCYQHCFAPWEPARAVSRNLLSTPPHLRSGTRTRQLAQGTCTRRTDSYVITATAAVASVAHHVCLSGEQPTAAQSESKDGPIFRYSATRD
jgi:hypothetical protein